MRGGKNEKYERTANIFKMYKIKKVKSKQN